MLVTSLKISFEEKNSKKFWNYVKSRKTYNIGVQPLKSNGKLHSEDTSKAEILNNQFKSVFTTDTEDPPTLTSNYPAIDNLYICKKGITKLLQNLKVNSASGPDNIANRVLKYSAEEITPILKFIFNQSLSSGTLPEDWLKANVAPIF